MLQILYIKIFIYINKTNNTGSDYQFIELKKKLSSVLTVKFIFDLFNLALKSYMVSIFSKNTLFNTLKNVFIDQII